MKQQQYKFILTLICGLYLFLESLAKLSIINICCSTKLFLSSISLTVCEKHWYTMQQICFHKLYDDVCISSSYVYLRYSLKMHFYIETADSSNMYVYNIVSEHFDKQTN